MTITRTTTAGIVAVALLMSASGPAASGQATPWWRSDAFRQELQLTDDQVAAIGAIYGDSLEQRRQTLTHLRQLEAELDALISNMASEAEILKVFDEVEAFRRERNKTRTLMLYRMQRVLSPSQRQRLRKLEARWRRDHSRG